MLLIRIDKLVRAHDVDSFQSFEFPESIFRFILSTSRLLILGVKTKIYLISVNNKYIQRTLSKYGQLKKGLIMCTKFADHTAIITRPFSIDFPTFSLQMLRLLSSKMME